MSATLAYLRQQLQQFGGLVEPSAVPPAPLLTTPRWSLHQLSGRLVEVTGTARFSTVLGLVLEAQHQGDLAAWITPVDRVPFPPHLHANGIDLSWLIFIRTPKNVAAHAADRLLRSGAIRLAVVDIDAQVPLPLQSRLLGLAQTHGTTVVFLQSSPQGLGSLISVRVLTGHRAIEAPTFAPERFACDVIAQKDKAFGPTWSHVEVCRGPDGLR